MKLKNYILMITGLIALSGCGSGAEKYMSIGEPEYVKEFKNSGELEPINDISCDAIGLRSIKAIGDLVILSHGNCWSIWDDDFKKDYGTCFSIGGGPNDFLGLPLSGESAYKMEGDSLIAYVCDKEKGKLMRFNVTEFITTGNENLSTQFVTDKIGNSTWHAIPLDGERVQIAMPNAYFTGFTRDIVTIDTIYEPEITKSLSDVTLESNDGINILAKVTRCDPTGDRFVEGMLYLNQLNIYSSDGKWGKTICVGDELDNVADMESSFFKIRKDTYESVSAWDFGFGAVYSGSIQSSLGLNISNSELQFFTWDGIPVYKAKMPISVRAFDINVDDKILYAIDSEEDVLKAYDASEILEAFNAFK